MINKPTCTVVIGVGGGGRGAVNWVKYYLEKEYGSCKEANTAILVIDGPENDQYVLPGNFQINTGDKSTEFYPLKESPKSAIKTIANGGKFKYISEWLSYEEAVRIPEDINPGLGFGGDRAAAYAALFLESSKLENKIKEVLRRAAEFKEDAMLDIFIVGSLAGGTGSGMLLGVSHLVKKNKRDVDNLYGVILLPNGYEKVITGQDQIKRRDAKSFVGLRELLRSQSADGSNMVRIAFSNNVRVENSQLYNMAFLIDGQGEGPSLDNVFPVYGLSAKSAELILAFIKNIGTIEPDKTNLFKDMQEGNIGHQKFSAFGVHSYYFPAASIVDSFALRITEEIYRRMYQVPENALGEGKKLANDTLRSTKFGTMLSDLSNLIEPPLQPPSDPKYLSAYQTLHHHLRIGDHRDLEFPMHPILRLEEEVKLTRTFKQVSNEDLVKECNEKIEEYLGKKAIRTSNWTVWAWAVNQVGLVGSLYASDVCRIIWEQFYDPETNKVRKLKDKPYTIGIVKNMLDELRIAVNIFEDKVDSYKKEYLGDVNNVVVAQEQRVEQLEASMVGSGKDRQFQEEYLIESQKLLELKLWEILVITCELFIEAYKKINERLWDEIGGHTKGWVTFLEACCSFIGTERGNVDNRREQLSRNKAKTFFPRKYGEQRLYIDKVINSDIVESILSEMGWSLGKVRGDLLTKLFSEGIEPADLDDLAVILNSPAMSDESDLLSRYTDQKINNLRIKNHRPEQLKMFAESMIKELHNMDIWEAIYYDFISHPEGVKTKEGKTAGQTYADDFVKTLTEMSGSLLSSRRSADNQGSNPQEIQYVMSEPLTAQDPKVDSKEYLAKCIYKKVADELNGIRSEPEMSQQITVLLINNKVSIFDWGYYEKSQQQYASYIEETGNSPIHISSQEKTASKLECKLYNELLLKKGEQLHYSVVKYLLPGFETFAYALVAGLFGAPKIDSEDNKQYYNVEVITSSGQTQNIKLETDLEKLLQAYLAPGKAGEALREAIKKRWKDYLSRDPQEEVINELKKALEDFISKDIKLTGSINSKHFKLAIETFIRLLIDND